MNYSFNLIDQPWIPCVTLADEYVELSLYDLLANAHQLREIACETPIMTASILPVTLALLHRIFGPEDTDAWEILWRQGAFPMSPISEYLDQWYERFDLFHPEYPFYQMRDERVQPKSVIHLIHSIGNTGTLFTHVNDETAPELSPAMAARYLLAAQKFRTAGLSGLEEKFTDSPLTRGVIFWATGNNVFELLVFNLTAYPSSLNAIPQTSQDTPIWEQSVPFATRNYPYGYLDYLTWPSNRIVLLPEQIGDRTIVNRMTIAPGLQVSADVFSPHKRYTTREDKEGKITWSFLYFNTDKALWRDYHSLISRSTSNVKPPMIINWLAELTAYVLDDNHVVHLAAMGMLADQAKPIFYRQERLPLPANLLRDEYKVASITKATTKADEVCDKLIVAARALAEQLLMRGGDRKPDGNDITSMLSQWDVRSLYWSQLESPFWDFIIALSNDEEDALDNWYQALRQAASSALIRASQMSGTSAPALHGQVAAERKLKAGIRKIFESSKE